jgi:hypothetical protein
MNAQFDRLNRRLTLYGIGAFLAGAIIALVGPPARSQRPDKPHPEDLWFIIPGWMIVCVGLFLLLYRIQRGFRTYMNSN